jgi:amino acid adenylation domain-containing protein
MTSLESLLSDLQERQIQLRVENDRLRYAAPPGAITEDILSRMRAQKAELIELFSQLASSQHQGIEPVVNRQNVPLSFTQYRLWFLHQLGDHQSTYHMPSAVRLRGPLNVAALHRALKTIVERHEALRTVFKTVDGQPVQIIQTPVDLPLEPVDLSHLSGEAQTSALAAQIHTETHRPFDLTADLMLRVALWRLDDDDHVLLRVFHHMAADGWSVGIFNRELASLYRAYQADKPPALNPLPIQYADFAVWQRQRLTGEMLAQQLAYWQRQLEGIPPELPLPYDRLRPPQASTQGASHHFHLSAELTQGLKQISRDSGVTLFMVLLAAFKVFLYRYTQQSDLAIGTSIAHRNRLDLEPLIGFFTKTLVLRTQLSGDQSFLQVLSAVKEVVLDGFSHQDIPFEKLVEELETSRDLSRNPLFQVLMNFQENTDAYLQLEGLEVEAFPISREVSKLDLELYWRDAGDRLTGLLKYNIDIFDSSTIAQLARHFQQLLTGLVEHPDQPISKAPLLSPAERQTMLVEWNQTHSSYAADCCVHELFEAQVERTPEAIAAVFVHDVQDESSALNATLTYQELNARANQVAHYLRSQGVGPEATVALYSDRALETIVGILGILKAGGAYVPIDPGLPAERAQAILADSAARWLLNHSRGPAVTRQDSVTVIPVDAAAVAQQPTHNPDRVAQPDNLAYILYTSGSTGQPKGVAIEQRSLLNFAAEARLRAYRVSPAGRHLLFGGLNFSGTQAELFMPLLVGARVYLASAENLLPGPQLAQLLKTYQITNLKITPSALGAIPTTAFPALQNITIFGELNSRKILDQWVKGRENLICSYGATEASSSSTCGYYHAEDQPIHIGKPAANTEIYILDAHQQPVPANVTGEICIAGLGLARGYWQQPDLTQEKFIPHPFSSVPGARLYRTGDLGRYLPEGDIEISGRVDYQVKIRGFRVELGEIEAALAQHPQVQNAAVVLLGSEPAEQRLVAYVMPEPGISLDQTSLRQFFRTKLPQYMWPAPVVTLETLPLTSSGKIDRQKLSRLKLPEPAQKSYEEPKTELELKLTQIWESVLNTQPIGLDHNFFELGGHSLLAVTLFTEIKQQLHQDLPLATLFQAPTVRELAAVLNQEGWQPQWASTVPIQPRGQKRPIFFHGGAADALTWAGFADLLGPDQPFYALQRPDLDGRDVTQTTVQALAAGCVKEMRLIQPQGPYIVGGHCFGGTVAFEIAQQLCALGEEVLPLLIVDGYAPVLPPHTGITRLKLRFYKALFWLRKNYYYHGGLDQITHLPTKIITAILRRLPKGEVAEAQVSSASQGDHGSPAPAAAPPGQSARQEDPRQSADRNLAPEGDDILPHDLRYARAHRYNSKARKGYVPKVFSGKAVLFRSRIQSLDWHTGYAMGWQHWVEPVIDVVEVPGFFGNLFNHRSGPLLAAAVRTYLAQQQENVTAHCRSE